LLLSNVEIFTGEMSETLYAVAFICGEYSQFLEDPGVALMSFYQQPRFMSSPPHVQATLIHNSLKLYVKVLEVCSDILSSLLIRTYL
ncbi:hypothetical protein, partial [Salmonella sp. s51228]|uniref:hypothetical protein n=1 Tax=Salmonella sp. s51228 TaxID=3159652 RepID=UPI00397EA2DE